MPKTLPPDPVHLIELAGSRQPGTLRDVLNEYGHRLVEAGAFTALRPDDVRVVAVTISQMAVAVDDGAEAMRERAAAVRDGWWSGWSTVPAAVANAFDVAAAVLDAM
jgi:hypothetical protein